MNDYEKHYFTDVELEELVKKIFYPIAIHGTFFFATTADNV